MTTIKNIAFERLNLSTHDECGFRLVITYSDNRVSFCPIVWTRRDLTTNNTPEKLSRFMLDLIESSVNVLQFQLESAQPTYITDEQIEKAVFGG